MRRLTTALCGGLATGAAALALACGGPESYDLNVEAPAERYLSALLTTGDGFDFQAVPQLRFLFPAAQAKLPGAAVAYAQAYQTGEAVPLPEEAELKAALAALQLDVAEQKARALVARMLDEPGAVADGQQDAFRLALEVLDLKSVLAGLPPEQVRAFFARAPAPAGGFTGALAEADAVRHLARPQAAAFAQANPKNPRLASVRYVALQEAIKARIPDGWTDGKATLSDADATALRGLVEAWLHDYPNHPLADLVRMLRVRLAYFRAEGEAAWKAALEVYPRHPGRALYEMRYLVKREVPPPASASADPVLLAALTNETTPLDEKAWAHAWQVSESPAARPVAVNLQERLLANAVRLVGPGKALPPGFPANAAAPTPLWAELRLAALLRAQRLDDALAQAKQLNTAQDATGARMVASVHLQRHEPVEAALVPGLEQPLRSFLIRIQLDDAALAALEPKAQGPVHAEVALSRAVRKAASGDWAGGAALLDPSDAARAKLWQQAGALSQSATTPEAKLAYAHFLRDHAGELFFSDSPGYSRSVKDHLPAPGKPASPEEERLKRYLFEGNAWYAALSAYAAYLSDPGATGKTAKAALAEADKLYNRQLNWDVSYSEAYKAALKDSPAAVAIRDAGKRIRASK